MRRWGVVLVIATAFVLVAGRWLATIYADWTWYDALGALPVYRSGLIHQLAWRVGAIASAFAFAFLNLYALRRSIVSLVLPRRLGNIEIGEAVSARALLGVVLAVSGVLAIVLSAPTGHWTTMAFARISGSSREMDPYLDMDLSQVVAWLPFELDLHAWMSRLIVVVALLILGMYALTPSLRFRRGDFYVSAYCRRHLLVLATFALLLLAWRSRLDWLSLTSIGAESGAPYGSYAHRIEGPFLIALSLATAVAAFVALWTGWYGYLRIAALAALSAALGGPLVRVTMPAIAGRSLSPSDLNETERPYATTRRLFTRRAFGVDEVSTVAVRELPALRAAAVGVPIWDPVALARSAPGGGLRRAVGIAWTPEPGGLRATAVVEPGSGSSTWSVAEFEATATDERLRVLPAIPASVGTPPIGGWQDVIVHPGAVGSLVVADSVGRIPAPPFSTRLERIAHAWNARAPRFAMAEQPSLRPRIAFRRDVRERVEALVPFLLTGPTIRPLVRGDSLYWVAEVYTAPRAYPLSERLMFAGERRPYVHHAATAFVHAATGAVTFVAADSPDAIMRAWMRRFPRLFLSASELAPAIAAVRPPPTDWASLQATALARTGLESGAAGGRAAMTTDNADADLLGEPSGLFATPAAALAWSAPLVDASGAVTGVLLALGGPNGRTLWVAAEREEKWSDVLDRLQRSADSAGVGRQRRNARRGHVRTVPTADGLLYVQTHYEWGAEGAPVAAGVAALTGGTARAGTTVVEALGLPQRASRRDGGAFRASVEALHRRMRDALRDGDWVGFGAAFSALGELLRGPGR